MKHNRLLETAQPVFNNGAHTPLVSQTVLVEVFLMTAAAAKAGARIALRGCIEPSQVEMYKALCDRQCPASTRRRQKPTEATRRVGVVRPEPVVCQWRTLPLPLALPPFDVVRPAELEVMAPGGDRGRRAEVAVAVEVNLPGGFERGRRRGEDGLDVGPGHGHGVVTGDGGGGRRRRRGDGRGAQRRSGARRAMVVSGEDEAAAAARKSVVGAGEDARSAVVRRRMRRAAAAAVRKVGRGEATGVVRKGAVQERTGAAVVRRRTRKRWRRRCAKR